MPADSVAIPVLYVRRRHAKTVKTALEDANLIDGDYKVVPADPASGADVGLPTSVTGECVAIPVMERCVDLLRKGAQSEGGSASLRGDWMGLVVGSGRQVCPASSSNLARTLQGGVGRRRRRCGGACDSAAASGVDRAPAVPLNNVQLAIVETLLERAAKEGDTNGSGEERHENANDIESAVRSLSQAVCPAKLERIGDDRTLVIPRTALTPDDVEFCSLLERFALRSDQSTDRSQAVTECLKALWSNLARQYGSPRVVRRGDINPESGVRASGHRILWPDNYAALEPGVPADTGPGSPGWITVIEHGIRQSFDLTREMFSRGNVTEKVRFGKHLVREGEVVLDMYAGIGYYTLPALILGRASHVYACEWNPHAAAALRYNLRDNGVKGKATVLEGDSRISASADVITGAVDRISLGLLPSSEGGWPVAVKSLRNDSGGWLHIHGNVPALEREKWAFWVCARLVELAEEQGRDGWVALCYRVEKVKSFAPKVDHYVADIFLGPKVPETVAAGANEYGNGIISADGSFLPSPAQVDPPSCALSRDGVLHQDWMM